VVIDPGHPKKTGDEIEYTIMPVDRLGAFPFPTTIDDPDYPCPDGYGTCIAAAYEVTGGRFNEIWLSFPVDQDKFKVIGVGPANNPSGYVVYPPCSSDGLLNSCFHTQVKISFQTTPSEDNQRFVLYFAPGPDSGGDTLGSGRSDFIGGSGSNNLFCPEGIEVPSTEVTCVEEAFDDKPRIEISQFENVLTRTWRNPDGCAFRVDLCETDNIDLSRVDKCTLWEQQSPVPDEETPVVGGIAIKDCGYTINTNNDIKCLDECSLVVAQNPGYIWYKIGGSWYRICGGYYNAAGQCCDPYTGVCTF
jgi:hypothetical protein